MFMEKDNFPENLLLLVDISRTVEVKVSSRRTMARLSKWQPGMDRAQLVRSRPVV